jgi:Trypsin
VLGEWKLDQDRDCEDDYPDESLCDPSIEVVAGAVAIHRDFKRTTFANDLALIKLVAPLRYTTLIQPVCLPLATTSYYKMNLEGKTLTAVGFGLTEAGSNSDIKKKADLTVMRFSECEAKVSATSKKIKVEKSMQVIR